jgi:hypothetical protein
MTWAHYRLLKGSDRKMVFHRPADWSSSISTISNNKPVAL